jgi:hypothetical protein
MGHGGWDGGLEGDLSILQRGAAQEWVKPPVLGGKPAGFYRGGGRRALFLLPVSRIPGKINRGSEKPCSVTK